MIKLELISSEKIQNSRQMHELPTWCFLQLRRDPEHGLIKFYDFFYNLHSGYVNHRESFSQSLQREPELDYRIIPINHKNFNIDTCWTIFGGSPRKPDGKCLSDIGNTVMIIQPRGPKPFLFGIVEDDNNTVLIIGEYREGNLELIVPFLWRSTESTNWAIVDVNMKLNLNQY